MKLIDCISVYKGLMSLYKKELPVVESYKISSAISKLEPVVSEFQSNRDSIINKLKSQSVDGNVDDDHAEEFKSAMSAVLDEDVAVGDIKIDLSSVSDLNVSPEIVRLCGDSVIFVKDA